MPINYIPSGVRRNDTYNAIGTSIDLCTSINTTLSACGWASTLVAGHNFLQFAAQPANADTCTIGGQAYTFNTTIGGANSVLIDTTVAGTAANLVAAIIAGAGGGVKYGTGTLANTSVTATVFTSTGYEAPSGVANVRLDAINTAGATSVTMVKSGANLSYYYINNATANQLTGWGYKLASATTPQGLKGQIYVYTNQTNNESGNGFVRIIVSNPEQYDNAAVTNGIVLTSDTASTNQGYGHILAATASVNWKVIANPYQFFVFVVGVSGTSCYQKWACGGVPYIPTWQLPLTITAASNATPIVLQTSTSHGYTTGDSVCVRHVQGNTAPNLANTWVITVLTATTFSLNTSVGNGVYVGGGIVGKVDSQVAECMWFSSTSPGVAVGFMRSTASCDSLDYTYLINGSLTSTTGVTAAGVLALVPTVRGTGAYTANPISFYNTYFAVTTPWIGGGTSSGGTFRIAGTPWDMGLWQKSFTADSTGTFDSHTFYNLTDNQNGSGGTTIQFSALLAIA